MFCKFCGTQMNDGDLFCPNCGKKQTNESGNASSASPTSTSQQTASTTQTAQVQTTAQPQVQGTPYVPRKSNAGVIGAVVGVVVVAAVLLGYMFVIKPQQEAKRIAETRQKVASFLRDVGRNELADAVMKAGIDARDTTEDWTALIIAALNNNSDIAKTLVQAGADINAKDNIGGTALMYTVVGNSSDVAKLLIQASANINTKDNEGWTALMFAAYKNNTDIAKMLMQAGADVNTKNNKGNTALIIAAANNSQDVAQLLINAKADINTVDDSGYTALSYAQDTQMQQLLYNAGAISTKPKNEMIFVQGGSFAMGNENGDSDERPIHTVSIASFYMSKYEITQAEWIAVMGNNPSYFRTNPMSGEEQSRRPVDSINWFDAIIYCNRRSVSEGKTPCYALDGDTNKVTNGIAPDGKNNHSDLDTTYDWDFVTCNWEANGYRLPTEAEWEYAARGGVKSNSKTLYSGSNNIDDVAWYADNSNKMTHEVGLKQSNELGFYDMTGNVYEWCWDWWGKTYYSNSPSNNPRGPSRRTHWHDRVKRGGDASTPSATARLTMRQMFSDTSRLEGFGVRVVLNGN